MIPWRALIAGALLAGLLAAIKSLFDLVEKSGRRA
jgi:hypothetical protein